MFVEGGLGLGVPTRFIKILIYDAIIAGLYIEWFQSILEGFSEGGEGEEKEKNKRKKGKGNGKNEREKGKKGREKWEMEGVRGKVRERDGEG